MTPELTVQGEELTRALKSVVRLLRPNNKAEATIGYADGTLSIELPGLSAGVPAAGVWPGSARFSAAFVTALARIPLQEATVTIRVEDGRLTAGPSSISCVWQDEPTGVIELPMNAGLRTILSLAYHNTREEIETAGFARAVADAEKERDTRLGRAGEALGVFGVTAQDLRRLVDHKMTDTSTS